MDRRITLALVAILVVLGGYIWYTFVREDALPINPPTPEPTAIPFVTFNPQDVTALEARESKSNQVTRVVRAGDKWSMEQPAQGEAFFSRVDSLLFQLSRLTANRRLTTPTDLAGFGLNPPQYELRITFQDGQLLTLQVGKDNPDQNYSYVMKSGDSAVYLIQSFVGQDIQEFVTMPPYTPTPSPTPGPTETPEATPTP